MTKKFYAKYRNPDWPSDKFLLLPDDEPIESWVRPDDLDTMTYQRLELTEQEYFELRG